MKKINVLGVGAALVDRQFSIEDNLLEELKLKKGQWTLRTKKHKIRYMKN